MYESWIIITDVGVEPDYREQWPKLGMAHIVHAQDFGSVCLGVTSLLRASYTSSTPYEMVKVAVQYFNDGPSVRIPPSLGTIGHLNITPLYEGEFPPVQICCDDIPEAEYGTYLAFDTLPVLNFIPLKE